MIQAETLELLEWPRLCQHLATFAATKLGAIAARQLPIPSTRLETQELLAQTREVYTLETRLATGLQFEGVQDIGEALERAERHGILSGEELLAIATTLAGTRNLRRMIDAHPDLLVLNRLVADLRTYPELEQEIHHCIDDNGEVADRASSKLAEVRQKLRQGRDRVYSLLQHILQRKANAIQEHLITQRSERFVVPVKASHRDQIPGIVHDTSMSGATLYVEPHATVEANNQLRQLQRQEAAEAEAVRRALTEKVAAVKEELEYLLAIATTLDLATARARYSLWLEANPPHLLEPASPLAGVTSPETHSEPGLLHACTAPITLRQLRHPLLVWQQHHEQGWPVVPIDLVIQPEIRVVAITGPNTGGKTVTLKTLGLAALMAKVGLFIPAREPVELPWFEQILADIGDEQSIEQSLSTFSGHIRRIVRILAALESSHIEATPPAAPSLVLLDEVGAGTDPSEGSALAIALLQHLANQNALTMATTHYGELKALKYQDERFENASVEFDEATLSPTYRLLWGIPGRSNALSIARRLGLAPAIVEQAQTLVGGASQEVNEVIAGLEAQRRRQEKKSQEAGKLLAQAERLHQELAHKAEALKQRERELQLAQEQAVQAAITEARQEIAQVIHQLQKGTPTAQAAQQATEQLQQLAAQHLPAQAAKPAVPKGFRPQVGDRVRIPRLGQVAEVLTTANDNHEIMVRFGLMKMMISLADVESLTGEKAVIEVAPSTPRRKPTASSVPPQKSGNASPLANVDTSGVAPIPSIRTSHNTIDIRGSRVADAEPVIEKALNSASGSAVWIIHGQGTGKLRQGVHTFLQHHPLVERFELAPREEGGSGVTIAYLRG